MLGSLSKYCHLTAIMTHASATCLLQPAENVTSDVRVRQQRKHCIIHISELSTTALHVTEVLDTE